MFGSSANDNNLNVNSNSVIGQLCQEKEHTVDKCMPLTPGPQANMVVVF